MLIHWIFTDRLRLKQEDPPPHALRPQGLPRPQRQRRRPPPHAQPNFRRRVRRTPTYNKTQTMIVGTTKDKSLTHTTGSHTPFRRESELTLSPVPSNSVSRSPTPRLVSPPSHRRIILSSGVVQHEQRVLTMMHIGWIEILTPRSSLGRQS